MSDRATHHRSRLWAVLALGLTAATTGYAAPIINNGSFQSGLAGWVSADSAGSDGTFSLQSGTASPVNGDPVPVPPAGNFAAMSDGEGPGSHVLYQDFLVPAPGGAATISFDLFIGNRGSGFFVPIPASLDFGIAAFNQQARVDILLAGTDPFSVAVDDVLLNLYQTQPGDPLVAGYSTISVDLTALLNAHAGEMLRLRFAETDNEAPFQLGVDQVAISVPEPATTLLLGAGLLGLMFVARRRRRSAAA